MSTENRTAGYREPASPELRAQARALIAARDVPEVRAALTHLASAGSTSDEHMWAYGYGALADTARILLEQLEAAEAGLAAAAEVQENQAARIRWLLHRASRDVYWEFTGEYAPDHPFTTEASDG